VRSKGVCEERVTTWGGRKKGLDILDWLSFKLGLLPGKVF